MTPALSEHRLLIRRDIDVEREEFKGRVKRVMGTIKENLGWLTGDHKAEDDG
ncbi:MAG: hypothetical protein IPJ07_16940 [Acidobacteria bacterium]|nr:hypothetical protein [Acidobacteriota bacterium]